METDKGLKHEWLECSNWHGPQQNTQFSNGFTAIGFQSKLMSSYGILKVSPQYDTGASVALRVSGDAGVDLS